MLCRYTVRNLSRSRRRRTIFQKKLRLITLTVLVALENYYIRKHVAFVSTFSPGKAVIVLIWWFSRKLPIVFFLQMNKVFIKKVHASHKGCRFRGCARRNLGKDYQMFGNEIFRLLLYYSLSGVSFKKQHILQVWCNGRMFW